MRKIAVTGAVGAGKTTVCKLLGGRGAYVVSADEIAHRLLGPVDRGEIAKKVFKDPKLLKELERALHPPILKEIQKEIAIAEKKQKQIFVCEVPLLFEAGWENYFDTTVCVVSNRPTDPERMRYQLSQEEKQAKADFIIRNNGPIEELENQISTLIGE